MWYEPEKMALFKRLGLGCYFAVSFFDTHLNYLYSKRGIKIDNVWLALDNQILSTVGRIPQLGQNALRFRSITTSQIGVVDVGCYLFGKDYKDLPIVIGDVPFVQRFFSEIYTEVNRGNPINVTLMERENKA